MALTITGLNIGGKILASKEVNYWITTVTDREGDLVRGTAVDPQGNIYGLTRNLNGSGGFDLVVVKFNPRGAVQWQKGLTAGTSKFFVLNGIADSSGNLYATGRIENAANTNSELFLIKFNSSGSVLWQRTLGGSSFDNGFGVCLDSSSNVYVIGETYSQSYGTNDLLIAKYNSSGTIQWQRRYGTTFGELGWEITVDYADNLIAVGVAGSASAGDDAILMKLSSVNGAITWQRRLSGSLVDGFRSVVTDTDNNVYAVGLTSSQTAGGNDILLVKYNSSGTIQWQKRIGTVNGDTGNIIRIDSNNNIYAAANLVSSGPGSTSYGLIKVDTSGNVLWQRAIGTTGQCFTNGFDIDSNDNLYLKLLVDPVSTIGAMAVAKLPPDGSLTGTYGSYVYQSISLTVANTTLTSSTSSLSSTATTLTSTTTSYTSTEYFNSSSTVIIS